MEKESIGQRISKIRQQKGLSVTRLAKLSGLSPSHITRIEHIYHTPNSKTIEKIANALNVSLDEIYGRQSSLPRTAEHLLAELQYVQPVAVPILAEGSAGEGDGFVEYAYWAKTKASNRNIGGILVKGDCLEPDVKEGDILFVDPDLKPKNNDLIVCRVDGKLQIKRYRDLGGHIWIENRYGIIKPDECVIKGVVIEKNIKMR